MDELQQARAEINQVDAEMAALFERRMAAVRQVLEYKRAHGLPVLDAGREKEVLARGAARVEDPALREYYARVACVVQLSHFVDSEHLEEGLSLLQQVKHPGYYAKMAAAWALSEWYVKFPQAVGQLLAQQTLEPWVQNKAIQKVRESRRVSKAEKDALLRYKLQPTP